MRGERLGEVKIGRDILLTQASARLVVIGFPT